MGEQKQREAAEAAERERIIAKIRELPWEEHVQAIYDEMAALCQSLGIPTPNLLRAGMQPADPGTILASFQQLATAVKQVQKISVVNEARTRCLLAIVKKLAPMQAPMFEAMFLDASDIAEQQATDPDKQGGVKSKLLVN